MIYDMLCAALSSHWSALVSLSLVIVQWCMVTAWSVCNSSGTHIASTGMFQTRRRRCHRLYRSSFAAAAEADALRLIEFRNDAWKDSDGAVATNERTSKRHTDSPGRAWSLSVRLHLPNERTQRTRFRQIRSFRTRLPGILCGWSGRLEQSTTRHSFGNYIIV